MYKYPILIYLFVSIIAASAQDHKPTAPELLDQFAETVDRFNSFRIVSKSKMDIGLLGEKYKTLTMTEIYCYDKKNKRFSERYLKWGHLPLYPSLDPPPLTTAGQPPLEYTPEDNARYGSRIKIGGKHTRKCAIPDVNGKKTGYASINTDERSTQFRPNEVGHRCVVGPIMGYLTMANPERIDTLLRKANILSVMDSMEEVAGSLCYVIEAVTDDGWQRLWIDPHHGHNIAKAEIEGLRRSDTRYKVCLKNIEFEQIDGAWTAIAFERERRDIRDDGIVFVENTYTTILELSINPDHKTLRSFDFDDIREGAQIKVIGKRGEERSINYIWQNGKPVPKG